MGKHARCIITSLLGMDFATRVAAVTWRNRHSSGKIRIFQVEKCGENLRM